MSDAATIRRFLEALPTQITKYPSPILRQVAEPIHFVTDDLRIVCRKMFELMYKWHGIGLAAPQVGLPYRFFIINPLCDAERPDKEMVFINPEIVHCGKRISSAIEGCLSLPGIRAAIDRPHKVMFRAMDLDGKIRKYCYEGTMGRIIHHENDHLDGILIIDRMSDREKPGIQPLIDKLTKEGSNETERSDPVEKIHGATV